VLLAVAVAAANAVWAPPVFLGNSNITLMFLKTLVMEIFLTFRAVEEFHSIQIGLILADLARLNFVLVADKKLSFLGGY